MKTLIKQLLRKALQTITGRKIDLSDQRNRYIKYCYALSSSITQWEWSRLKTVYISDYIGTTLVLDIFPDCIESIIIDLDNTFTDCTLDVTLSNLKVLEFGGMQELLHIDNLRINMHPQCRISRGFMPEQLERERQFIHIHEGNSKEYNEDLFSPLDETEPDITAEEVGLIPMGVYSPHNCKDGDFEEDHIYNMSFHDPIVIKK